MARCWILFVNRGIAKLYKKRCNFEASSGTVKNLFRQVIFTFTIADNVKPLTLDLSTMTAKNRTVPLFVVNEQSCQAIGQLKEVKSKGKIGEAVEVKLIEEDNPDVQIVLSTLTKRAFWDSLVKRLKVHLKDILIFMFAGYGILRFIEYAIRIVVLKQG